MMKKKSCVFIYLILWFASKLSCTVHAESSGYPPFVDLKVALCLYDSAGPFFSQRKMLSLG